MASLDVPNTNNIQTGVSREFDVPFQIHATKDAWVAYTVEMNVVQQEATCDLMVEAVATPANVVSSAAQEGAVLLGLVSIEITSRQVLLAWVPGGYNVMLTAGGSGTVTLVDQTEVTFDA